MFEYQANPGCSAPACSFAALGAGCRATGGQPQRAGTRTTALSQHCLCGQRVPKTPAQRTHHCPHCGLHADRDIASAVLAACVELADPDDSATRPRQLHTCPRATRWVGLAAGHGVAPKPQVSGPTTASQEPTAAPSAGDSHCHT
ncbi:MAG: zinc ribbon domain-containing protein [Mycobacterium sp.]